MGRITLGDGGPYRCIYVPESCTFYGAAIRVYSIPSVLSYCSVYCCYTVIHTRILTSTREHSSNTMNAVTTAIVSRKVLLVPTDDWGFVD